MTMIRLNITKGLGPTLQILEGKSIDLPETINNIVVGRTDPTWPKTFFVPRIEGGCLDVYSAMKNWGLTIALCVLATLALI